MQLEQRGYILLARSELRLAWRWLPAGGACSAKLKFVARGTAAEAGKVWTVASVLDRVLGFAIPVGSSLLDLASGSWLAGQVEFHYSFFYQ